jgi:hypothetical protein
MVSLTSAKVVWMPHDASLIVLLVTIFLPVDPLSLTVNTAKVLVRLFYLLLRFLKT